MLKITLPAAIVTNFSRIELDPSMLGLALPGFLGGAFLILLALALNAHKSRDSRAFDILNLSGYNIGNFTMPFAQGFLGPMGVAAHKPVRHRKRLCLPGRLIQPGGDRQGGEGRIFRAEYRQDHAAVRAL